MLWKYIYNFYFFQFFKNCETWNTLKHRCVLLKTNVTKAGVTSYKCKIPFVIIPYALLQANQYPTIKKFSSLILFIMFKISTFEK